jgi:hypothetical protein
MLSLLIICVFQGFVLFAIYRVFSENKRVVRSAYELHAINHEYRDALSGLFSVYEAAQQRGRRLKMDDLMLVERIVLERVCRRIADVFWTMAGRKCVVTVKLMKQDENQLSCFTWARSTHDVRRSDEPQRPFKVGTGDNTAFDVARRPRDCVSSHFYSGDLRALAKAGKYKNERTGWENLYNCAIIVPIRHVIDPKTENVHELGFLCVDTMSSYRLNGTYHVELLAAFADQMYNFLSIMRHKYVLIAEDAAAAEGS